MEMFFVTCKTCMTLRAKLVRWLGIRLGVMEPIKEKPMEQQQGFTMDQITAIIGTKELELIALRLEIGRLKAKYEPAPEPNLKVVETKGA